MVDAPVMPAPMMAMAMRGGSLDLSFSFWCGDGEEEVEEDFVAGSRPGFGRGIWIWFLSARTKSGVSRCSSVTMNVGFRKSMMLNDADGGLKLHE